MEATGGADPRFAASRLGPGLGLVLVIWGAGVAYAAARGWFYGRPGEPPVAMLAALGFPVLTFVFGYAFSPRFRHWVLQLDRRRLVLLHTWRMLGLAFVFLYFAGQLPALFAYLAGIGDALVALGATLLVMTWLDRPVVPAGRGLLVWNTFGLLDFVVAVSVGVLTRSGAPLDMGAVDSNLMGTFPLVMIPAFIVPLFVITHLIIYLQAYHARRHRAPSGAYRGTSETP